MSVRVARFGLVMSSMLVVGVVVVAMTGSRGSADLVGAAVRADTSSPASAADRAGGEITPPVARAVAPEPAPDPAAQGLAVPPPAQLRIGSIDVDDPVRPVGLEADGSLEIPGPDAVGWYRGSVAPGSPFGSSVLSAHVDYDGSPGAFIELGRLELGAEIFTVDTAGREHRFVVSERYQVAKDELDVDELFRRDGPPVLTLITCGGSFQERTRHYRDNIVVRAVPA